MFLLHIIPVFLTLFITDLQTKPYNSYNVMIINEKENIEEEIILNKEIGQIQTNNRLGFQIGCNIVADNENIFDGQSFLDHICKIYEDAVKNDCAPHLIIDLTSGEPYSEAAKTFSLSLGLPTVAVTSSRNIEPWNLTDTNQAKFLIQISPPADVVPEIIPVICRMQSIDNAAIFYDNTFKMERIAHSLMEGMAVRQVFINITDLQDFKRILRSVQDVDIVNYFILGSLKTITNVLENLTYNYYISKKYAWHAITLEEGTIQLKKKDMKLLFVKPISIWSLKHLYSFIFSQFKYQTAGIVHSFYEDLISRAVISLNIFSHAPPLSNNRSGTHKSLCSKNIIIANNIKTNFRKHFFKFPNNYRYGPIIFEENNTGLMKFNMVLEEVNLNDSSVSLVGYWSAIDTDLKITNKQKMNTLVSIPIYKVALVLQPPFVIQTIHVNGNKNYSGFCIDLIDEISKMVGFEYELYLTPDDKLGNMDEKGEWNGLIKEVLEKRADIGLSALSVTAEREIAVEFTKPFYHLVGMTILMKKTDKETNFFKFFTVMENDVWVCLVITYIFTSLFIWLFNRLNPSTRFEWNLERMQLDQEVSQEFTFKECFWFCMISLTPQGGGEAPTNLPGRLIAAAWWLFGWSIIASYTANLAALLTVSRLEKPINSLEDLANQYRVKYAPLRGSSGMTYFERMADIESRFQREWKTMSLNDKLTDLERRDLAVWSYPISDKYTKMWKAMQDAGLPLTIQEAVDRVLASRSSTDGFAFIGDGTNLKYHTMVQCDLISVGEEFCKLPLAMAIQKSSPIKESINKAITKLLHKRRLEQLKEKWWEENPSLKTCPSNDGLAEGISFENIAGVFSVILIGTVMSFFVLTCEYVWLKSKSRKPFHGLHKHINQERKRGKRN